MKPELRAQSHLTRCLTALLVFLALGSVEVFAQKKITRTFPAKKNIRLQLVNISGTVVVEGWGRDEIKMVAEMEAPAANFTPQQTDDALTIDVKSQNQRKDAGSVNFKIWTPNSSVVDIETGQGNISVKDINGSMVRAHVWLGGDIELLNLQTPSVMAYNTTGDIIFDGVLAWGGKYEFKSTQGNISIRIPGDSAFNLNATSPERSINLGVFASGNLNQSDPRKAVGRVGNNAQTLLTVFNQKGRIAFSKR